MPIEANTAITLCAGVLWDKEYNHVRLFESAADRLSYLDTIAIKRMTGCTYQRDTRAIRAPYPKEEVEQGDYLYYINNYGGNKYHFAFITHVEFVNFNCCDIFFQIDQFQTWFDAVQLWDTFIEREIVADDTFGKHTIPEGLETGEYVFNSGVLTQAGADLLDGNLSIVCAVSEALDGSTPEPIYDHAFNALQYYIASISRADEMYSFIRSYAERGKAAAIVSVFMYPEKLLGFDYTTSGGDYFQKLSQTQTTHITAGFTTNYFAPLDGYTPRNNKMFCYPYRGLTVYGAGGSEKIYRYELFESGKSTDLFTIFSALGGSAPIMAVPNNYKGFSAALDEGYQMPPYPTCSWLTDNYENWLAQNQRAINLQTTDLVWKGIIGGAISTVGSIASGNLLGALGAGLNYVGGLYDSVSQMMIRQEQAQMVPDSVNGSTAQSSAYFSNGQFYMQIFPKCIRREMAEKIDMYFSMFGYKVNRTGQPNIRARQNWDYLKAPDSAIIGAIPVEAKDTIRAAIAKGVTFWHTNKMYDYAQTNAIKG